MPRASKQPMVRLRSRCIAPTLCLLVVACGGRPGGEPDLDETGAGTESSGTGGIAGSPLDPVPGHDEGDPTFKEAVEDYLELCAEQGRQPDRPFKGSFSVRVGKELHRQAVLMARQQGLSLNAFVIEALKEAGRRKFAE